MGLCCILADAAARLSVWEPAGRGRGRRDAVATHYRLRPEVRHATALQTGKRPFAAIWNLRELYGKLSVHQHPRLKGERSGFCALLLRKIDCDQPSANIAPNVQRQQDTGWLFLHVKKKSAVHTLNRWLIISCSASCKPEHEHQLQPTRSLSPSWYHLARPPLRHYAHLST